MKPCRFEGFPIESPGGLKGRGILMLTVARRYPVVIHQLCPAGLAMNEHVCFAKKSNGTAPREETCS